MIFSLVVCYVIDVLHAFFSRRSIMTEFNGSDGGPLGVGEGCVIPRDGKQVDRLCPSLLDYSYRSVCFS